MERANCRFYGNTRHTSTKLSVATDTMDIGKIRSPGKGELFVWSKHC